MERIKLDTARELSAAGGIRDTTVVGQRGGYSVVFRIGISERVLGTKYGVPRLFRSVDVAGKVLAQIFIARYSVDASGLVLDETTRRRRPDRAAALKKVHQAAAQDGDRA